MRFDDRLTTVLNQPARTRHDKAVRWRQLVDLVARAGGSGSSAVLEQALETVRAEAELVDEPLRAAAARAIAALPLPMDLLEIIAADVLAVSAPVLAAAKLDPAGWRRLAGIADPETRKFIATLHPEAGVAAGAADDGDTLILTDRVEAPVQPAAQSAPPATLPPSPALSPGAASLADVVARIERRNRRTGRIGPAPLSGTAAPDNTLFRWECGPSGDIHWVEGAPRAAIIGRSVALARSGEGEGVEEAAARAFARRSPFRDAPFIIDQPVGLAGEWKLSGVPAFDPADGRFAGYRGIALRDPPARSAPSSGGGAGSWPASADPASLRELVHEIKTPLNAIIGFAEIIDGQYLGPADHRYRQRAAHIVEQARLLLSAIDDLDFAAKAHAQPGPSAAPLGHIVEDLIHDLRARARSVGADVDIGRALKDVDAAIPPALAERVVRSVLMAVIDQAESGESLSISVDRAGERCRVAITRPRALAGLNAATLFGNGRDQAGSPPGIGFSLRLAKGLARIAGASLVATDRDLALLFDRA